MLNCCLSKTCHLFTIFSFLLAPGISQATLVKQSIKNLQPRHVFSRIVSQLLYLNSDPVGANVIKPTPYLASKYIPLTRIRTQERTRLSPGCYRSQDRTENLNSSLAIGLSASTLAAISKCGEEATELAKQNKFQEAIWICIENQEEEAAQVLRNELVTAFHTIPYEIKDSYLSGHSQKYTLHFQNGMIGIFKPNQSGAKAEIGASALNDILGINLLPTTIPFKIRIDAQFPFTGKRTIKGSLQYFVEGLDLTSDLYSTREFESTQQFKKMNLLDFILDNPDRRPGNIVTVKMAQGQHPDYRIIPVDHGELENKTLLNSYCQELTPSRYPALVSNFRAGFSCHRRTMIYGESYYPATLTYWDEFDQHVKDRILQISPLELGIKLSTYFSTGKILDIVKRYALIRHHLSISDDTQLMP